MSLNNILTELGFKPNKSNWKHFLAGALFSVGVYLFAHFELDYSLWLSVWIAIGASFLLGLAKEIFDKWLNPRVIRKIKKGNFDWLDLIMTTLGGIASTTATALLTLGI